MNAPELSTNDEYGPALLQGTTTVAGWPMHVEAIAVDDRSGVQVAADAGLQPALEALYALAEPGGPFETHEIDGRHYVLAIYPFS